MNAPRLERIQLEETLVEYLLCPECRFSMTSGIWWENEPLIQPHCSSSDCHFSVEDAEEDDPAAWAKYCLSAFPSEKAKVSFYLLVSVNGVETEEYGALVKIKLVKLESDELPIVTPDWVGFIPFGRMIQGDEVLAGFEVKVELMMQSLPKGDRRVIADYWNNTLFMGVAKKEILEDSDLIRF